MQEVIVAGGGLAGMAATAALADAGFHVRLFESRGFLGGRATSFPLSGEEGSEVIDNCQHVLLRCCVNLLDFYRRLGVADKIRFDRELCFIEPGGRVSRLSPGLFNMAGSFARARFLRLGDKLAIARALSAIKQEYRRRPDLDSISMLDWLREKKQPRGAIDRFWRQVLVSAVNEDVDRMAASHGLQVFFLGFLARADSYEIGTPAVLLGQLYRPEVSGAQIHMRSPVERIVVENGRAAAVEAGGDRHAANWFICTVPFERLPAVVPELGLTFESWEHSPITGIHLWFDRPVTSLPHATLLDRTIQWFFNKDAGRYLQVVVSASRSLVEMPREDVISLAIRELADFLPTVREAKLTRAQVIKEVRATFSARPGLKRPPARTKIPNLFLAGDWTDNGWPATMEGAVRSGYLAAEAVCEAAGRPRSFLLPDVA